MSRIVACREDVAGPTSPRNYNFKVFTRDNERPAAVPVRLFKEIENVCFQGGRFLCIEGRERTVGGTIISAENVKPMIRRFVSKGEDLNGAVDFTSLEQLPKAPRRSPESRRLDAGQRRHVFRHRSQKLPYEAVWRPVRKADFPTFAHNAG